MQQLGDRRTRGAVRVVRRTPQYLHTQLSGRFDKAACRELITLLDDWSAGRKEIIAFHDASQVTDYDVDARDELVRWSRSRHQQFAAVHLLVESRTIAWVLQIVNAVTAGKMTTHHSRLAFDAAAARVRL
jgi:hypothetical protein